MEHFRPKAAGGGAPAQSPCLLADWAGVSDRLCVLAWQGHRGEKLHACEDARLMATELNREWPDIEHWAAPATADEIRAHAAQAARLVARKTS